MRLQVILLVLFSAYSFAGTVRVAVAANVSYAIDDLKKAFYQKNPETKIDVVLGSSGKLTAQIMHGAPYKIFMSANMAYPTALYEKKLAISEPKVYALGTIALFSVKDHDFSKGLELLVGDDISKIAIANPKTAPYGTAAFEALKNSNYLEKVKDKFIFGESVSQTVSYAVTATDIGIIATSSLYSKQMKKYNNSRHWSGVDREYYTPIKQGIVLLKGAKNDAGAKAFYDFILSPAAGEILKRYGYEMP